MQDHATGYYVDGVTRAPTSEQECLRLAFRPLNRLFGTLPVRELDSLKLEALQQAMAMGGWLNTKERKAKDGESRPHGTARTTINRHTDRVKRLFRWGCSKKLVAAETLVNLDAVPSLKQGRTAARETAPVAPVDQPVVEGTLPFLPPVPADIVRLLLLTGARVGELCRLRTCDIDHSGPVWLYHPPKHKTLHHGHTRTVAFGPKAQLILRQYLRPDAPDAPLFSPAEQDARRKPELRAKRKTPVQPSQRDRSKGRPKYKPGECYDPKAINLATRRACTKAKVER